MNIKAMAMDDAAILSAEDRLVLDHKFFITAKTLEGARFISEDFSCFDDADAVFQKYIDVVKYFSDCGSVTMYEYCLDEFEVVKDKTIFKF